MMSISSQFRVYSMYIYIVIIAWLEESYGYIIHDCQVGQWLEAKRA